MSDDGKNKGRRRGAAKTTGAERGLASKGGVARAKKLSPKRRSEIAREGALAKQAKAGNAPAVAKYGAPDRPLRIGAIEIPCYVLADGTRVLAQRGLQSGIGLSEGGGKGGARKLVTLMEYFEKKGIDTRGLIVRAESPIRFMPPHGGNIITTRGDGGRQGERSFSRAVRATPIAAASLPGPPSSIARWASTRRTFRCWDAVSLRRSEAAWRSGVRFRFQVFRSVRMDMRPHATSSTTNATPRSN